LSTASATTIKERNKSDAQIGRKVLALDTLVVWRPQPNGYPFCAAFVVAHPQGFAQLRVVAGGRN
jgi:hypothetical protein